MPGASWVRSPVVSVTRPCLRASARSAISAASECSAKCVRRAIGEVQKWYSGWLITISAAGNWSVFPVRVRDHPGPDRRLVDAAGGQHVARRVLAVALPGAPRLRREPRVDERD